MLSHQRKSSATYGDRLRGDLPGGWCGVGVVFAVCRSADAVGVQMTTQGGGFELIFQLSTRDSVGRHYQNTFWTSTDLVGSIAAAMTGDYKASAWAKPR
jgi:hypothetical protein